MNTYFFYFQSQTISDNFVSNVLKQIEAAPELYPPPATSELSVYSSHNKSHSAEDILIRSAERLVLIYPGR